MLGLSLSLGNLATLQRRSAGGGGTPTPTPTATYLTDDAGNRMTADNGDRLILETA